MRYLLFLILIYLIGALGVTNTRLREELRITKVNLYCAEHQRRGK